MSKPEKKNVSFDPVQKSDTSKNKDINTQVIEMNKQNKIDPASGSVDGAERTTRLKSNIVKTTQSP